MSDRQAWDVEISSFLKDIYRCADRSSWYSSVADAYDRTRPRYPAKILARMQEIAQLQPGKSVEQLISRVTYSIDDYLSLLSTLSPYISLESKQRHLLLAELKRLLEINYGNDLKLSYLSILQIAHKS